MCIDPRAKYQFEISESDMQARADADYSQSNCIWIYLILCPHIFTLSFYACQQITYFPNAVFLDWTWQWWHGAGNRLWEHGMLKPCDPQVSLMGWYKGKMCTKYRQFKPHSQEKHRSVFINECLGCLLLGWLGNFLFHPSAQRWPQCFQEEQNK